MVPSHQHNCLPPCKDRNVNIRCHNFNCQTSLCALWVKMFLKVEMNFHRTVSSLPLRQLKKIRGWCLWLWNKIPGPKEPKAFNWAMQPCSPRALENLPNQQLRSGQADGKSITANVIWWDNLAIRAHSMSSTSKQFRPWSIILCHTFHFSALRVILEP